MQSPRNPIAPGGCSLRLLLVHPTVCRNTSDTQANSLGKTNIIIIIRRLHTVRRLNGVQYLLLYHSHQGGDTENLFLGGVSPLIDI